MYIYFFAYFIFVHLSLLIPGYTIVNKLGILKNNQGIQLCLGYVFSLVLFAILATANYVLRVDPVLTRILCWAILLCCGYIFVKARYYKSLVVFRFPLLCLIAMNLISLAFISLSFNAPYSNIPDPQPLPARNYGVLDVKVLNVAHTVANDNYIPYRQAQFFVNRSNPATDSFISEWGVSFFVRTPLMGAVVANYFNLLSDKPPVAYTWSVDGKDPNHTFIKFQMIAQILNSLLILPGFFLLSKLLSKKTAIISCLFLATSQFYIYNTFFSWPKSLVAFFILTSWLLLLRTDKLSMLLAGAVSGVAYLTHDLAILYIGASFIYLLIRKRLLDLLLFSLPILTLASPWFIISSLKYHKKSSFIYYPFSIHGLPSPDKEKTIFKEFFSTSPFELLYIRLRSIFFLLTPYQLINGGGQPISTRVWAVGLYSIPGALGLGLIIPGYISLVKSLKQLWLAIFILVPVLLCILIIGWPDGYPDALGALHFAEAIVVLWTGIAIHWLLNLKNKLWVMVAYVVNAAQLLFFIAYSYKFSVGNWIHSAHSIAACAIIAGLTISAGWLILQVLNGRKIRLLDIA